MAVGHTGGHLPAGSPFLLGGVRGHRLFRKGPFLKRPETGGGPDNPVYFNSKLKMGKIRPSYTLGEALRNKPFLLFPKFQNTVSQ